MTDLGDRLRQHLDDSVEPLELSDVAARRGRRDHRPPTWLGLVLFVLVITSVGGVVAVSRDRATAPATVAAKGDGDAGAGTTVPQPATTVVTSPDVDRFLALPQLQTDPVQVDSARPETIQQLMTYTTSAVRGEIVRVDPALPEPFELMGGQAEMPGGAGLTSAGVNVTIAVAEAGATPGAPRPGSTVTYFLRLWTGPADQVDAAEARISPVVEAAPIGAHVVALVNPDVAVRGDGAHPVARLGLYVAPSEDAPVQPVDSHMAALTDGKSFREFAREIMSIR